MCLFKAETLRSFECSCLSSHTSVIPVRRQTHLGYSAHLRWMIKNDWREPEEEKFADEHSFLGFKPKNNMSNGALRLQAFANNILENTVINSHQQSLYIPVPLPAIQNLAANNFNERAKFARARLKGYKLEFENSFANTNKVVQHKTWRVNHTIEI